MRGTSTSVRVARDRQIVAAGPPRPALRAWSATASSSRVVLSPQVVDALSDEERAAASRSRLHRPVRVGAGCHRARRYRLRRAIRTRHAAWWADDRGRRCTVGPAAPPRYSPAERSRAGRSGDDRPVGHRRGRGSGPFRGDPLARKRDAGHVVEKNREPGGWATSPATATPSRPARRCWSCAASTAVSWPTWA